MPSAAHKAVAASTGNTATAWATRFLIDIGAPVNATNINNIIRWGTAESGNPTQKNTHGGWANYNPLNVVVQSNDNHTGQGGTQGDIADFGNVNDGADASARLFMNNKNAAPIISTLRASGSTGTLNNAINSFYSSWGGSLNITGIAPSGGNTSLGGTHATLTGIDVTSPSFWEHYLTGGLIGAFTNSGNPFKSVSDVLKVFGTIGVFISNVFDNWRYVAEFLGGAVLLAFGIFIIMHDMGVTTKVTQTAVKAAEVGAVA